MVLLTLAGCGGSAPAGNGTLGSPDVPAGRTPFDLKEPAVYQAEMFVEGDGISDRWFVARKNGMSRVDIFDNGALVRSRLVNGGAFSIDHVRKVYTADPAGGAVPEDVTERLFAGETDLKFSPVGPEGEFMRYRAPTAAGGGEVDVLVDEKHGLIMRQEFRQAAGQSPNFVVEMRGVKFETDDTIFALPSGYEQVGQAEYFERATQDK